MKILDVPTVSTTDVKKSPAKIAKMAADLNTGVYVLNRGKAVSVTLTPKQYQQLVEAQERLLDIEAEEKAREAINNDDGTRISADKVSKNSILDQLDPDDGWE